MEFIKRREKEMCMLITRDENILGIEYIGHETRVLGRYGRKFKFYCHWIALKISVRGLLKSLEKSNM